MSKMSHFILSDTAIDRWVLRSLRRFSGIDTVGLQVEVHRRLAQEGIIAGFQLPPDENDIWRSLQRLTLARRVDKYVYETKEIDRAIRYRVSEK
jgi:hypothetical protein